MTVSAMIHAKIIGIGACVMDTLVTVPEYPTEDTKMRASAVKYAGGGPTATGIVAAAKLGIPTAFAGLLSDDSGGIFLLDDFIRYNVSTKLIRREKGYRSFTSTVLLSEKTATRTCVFDKGNLPRLELSQEQENAIRTAELLMIDGNEMDAAEAACRIAKESGTKVLYDCGGLYDGVERLLKLTDLMIPSEEFAEKHTGKATLREAALELYNRYAPSLVVITCGKEGGIGFDGKEFWNYPAFPVKAIDSNGAGDVFHGAFAAGLSKGYSYQNCCLYASAVAALKCTGFGARASIPDHETTIHFLKEKGYEL